jgi:hypothetical protein
MYIFSINYGKSTDRIQPYTYTMPTWNLKPDHIDDRTRETTPYLSS